MSLCQSIEIHYRRKILRDLQTEKKAENQRFRLLPSSSFLEASTDKVWKIFQLLPEMTEDEGTQTLHDQELNDLTLPRLCC